MPSQASVHKQKDQATKSNQLAHVGNGSPDTPSLSATVNKIDIQELQSVEDGTLEAVSRKVAPAQADSSIACFTVGRPPLYAGAGDDEYNEEQTDTTRARTAQDIATEEDIATYQPPSTIPLPKRCAARAVAGSVLHTKKSDKEKSPSKVTKAAATTLESAVDTFPSTTTLNCRPWTGDGPEDRLTDVAIKEGYLARYKVSSESAAKSLWPHLKSGVGLASISALFTDVLTERQEAGRIDAPSTFKPPPRVTLTDTKREAWLKDLANPGVSLKRLSRMIPHGLRGRALLDQCLIKQIPPERAVWLAQCVGANDLRAFRRKGISGGTAVDNESKWSLEWTSIVESFISDCIGSIPQPDWRTKVTYAVQITSSLFVNHLLTEDHFLSWLPKNLNSCSQQALIVWLAFTSQYAKPIVQDCSRGKRFAQVLFARTAEFMGTTNKEPSSQMKQRLMRLIYALVQTLPTCVLMPEQNQLCHKILKDLASKVSSDDIHKRTRNILNRNVRLATRIDGIDNTVLDTEITLDIFLDNLSLPCNIVETSSACVRFGKTLQGGVSKLLRWASNAYSVGQHRKYVALTILTSWAEDEFDLTECVLNLLPQLDREQQVDCRAIGRIVAELARKGIFNAASALRWFIVNGSISAAAGQERISCTNAVLLDIPESVLAPSVVNIRRMLIRSAGISTITETEAIERMKHMYQTRFEMMQKSPSQGMTGNQSQIEPEFEEFSCNSIFDFTFWLCNQCDTTAVFNETLDELQIEVFARRAVFILNNIDEVGDYCALVDCCHQVIKVKHVDILACISDILWRNFHSLMAMTAGVSLPRLVLDNYCLWRATSPPSRLVVDPLLATFRLLHTRGRILEYLELEVVLWNQNLTMTASSPMSDFQVEIPQPGANLLEDLENIIASNPVFDESCVQRLFCTLTTHWDVENLARGDEIAITILLNHLKRAYTEDLAREWLNNMLLKQSLWNGVRNIPTLIRIGCFTMKTFTAAALNVHRIAIVQDSARAAMLAMVVLRAIVSIIERVGTNETGNEDSQSMSAWTTDLVCFLQACLFVRTEQFVDNFQVLCNRLFVSVFVRVLSQEYKTVERVLDMKSLLANKDAAFNLRLLVLKLVDPLENYDLTAKSIAEVIRHVFETIATSSAPVCKFALACLLSIEGRYDDRKEELNAAVLTVVNGMANKDRTEWTLLLSVLDDDVLSKIGKSAADHLLSTNSNTGHLVHLEILQASVSKIPFGHALDICRQAVDKLDNIGDAYRDKNENEQVPSVTIETLLEICLMYKRTLFRQPEAQTLKEDLILCLCRLVAGRYPGVPAGSLEFILDVAACFVEDLTFNTKQQLSARLGPTISTHATIKFLLGFEDRKNGWLYATKAGEGSASALGLDNNNKEERRQPFTTKPWEMLVDATPVVGANDTALSLGLFGARRV